MEGRPGWEPAGFRGSAGGSPAPARCLAHALMLPAQVKNIAEYLFNTREYKSNNPREYILKNIAEYKLNNPGECKLSTRVYNLNNTRECKSNTREYILH